eukprot:CAMPEP_0182547048 /NCGR_PEP_ID=MMETSP1323-20130603/36927_1 /TAXON_ID=236787 /ORGANISM="Florenciella parvula, Strain RCC1693" /LENGTH=147 /DNA_ID=CAMNT_0024758321 /DNA_START=179 /DNA_END=622 /DNA_ORIENTATION=+
MAWQHRGLAELGYGKHHGHVSIKVAEGVMSSRHFDRRDTYAPNITASLRRAWLQDLWCHPRDAACEPILWFATWLLLRVQAAEPIRAPEVRKFHGTVLVDQQISALQVPMNNLVAVEIFQPLEHLPQVLAEHIDLQAAAESFHDLRD